MILNYDYINHFRNVDMISVFPNLLYKVFMPWSEPILQCNVCLAITNLFKLMKEQSNAFHTF